MNVTTSDLDREQVRAALAAIVERDHGVLNPRTVLDAARDPGSILHRYFEWNDGDAAEQYRLLQVGSLVRHVRLTIIKPDAVTREISIETARSFQSRPSMRRASGGYEHISVILGDAEKRAELLQQVVRELAAYRKRYAELSELDPVWISIDEATDHVSPSPAPSDGDARPGAAV